LLATYTLLAGVPLDLEGRDTGTLSTRFKMRRVEDVLVVETISEGLNNPEALVGVWEEALEKQSKGVIIHLPTPKYVSSLFIRTLLDCAEDARKKSKPFVVVVHPKLRLLFQMFELLDEVPMADRLNRAVESIAVQAAKLAATEQGAS